MTTTLLHLPAKLCTMCKVSKPRTEFSERWQKAGCKERYRASNAYCKPCACRVEKGYREAKDKVVVASAARKSHIKSHYGLTLEDFDRMLEMQGGACAICKTTTPGGRGGRFHVDHCHKTGAVRGLLCCNCNRGIGALKDDVALLQRAVVYLEEYGL